ncbi:HEPN domain-containing protein [Sediminitomix flava]|uniref:Sulfite reductase (Ferredoxin) n=1 Tax=Sediminitomix flava TaxID=379075 RepID=A0A315ZB06_SEDFL|nr:HEPN domain-containing protein [Sediminitomix flava]PWJ42731.1 sulfite reductase (ferredoxin) [Sediminitomix flava]
MSKQLEHLAPAVQKDIKELETKIERFQLGQMDEEKFKLYRLTRGVYGQRQLGVHMFRTKIPYGKLTADQLIRLADTSEKYTNGNLHLTTRQNIQYHYVKLNDSPLIWKELGELGVTAREACGNTVRNMTASAKAGVDPNEPFDVSPYVHAAYEYFLRNPICQEMGRKIKPAFSSSEQDSAFTYIHDFGFIPKVKTVDGEEVRGFKVLVGGGLGAQSFMAPVAFEFLEEDQVIPFMEAAIRVFDRYGEREKRHKARMKFLIKNLGLETFLQLVEEERKAIKSKTFKIDRELVKQPTPPEAKEWADVAPSDAAKFELWKATNTFEQKQKGFYGVQIKVLKGDIDAERARQFAAVVKEFAADDIRLTINQGILIKYVRPESFVHLFEKLNALGLAEPGFDSTGDVTSCPGTDTCNLGVTNSMGLAVELEKLIQEEYPHLLSDDAVKIKISGCMNSCGQHMVANIGFHGSSIKKKPLVIPAMQVVIGGGVNPDGEGFIAEKVIKIPTKRIPQTVRILLDDYEENREEGEYYNNYFRRQGKMYFYGILKHLAEVTTLEGTDQFDWGEDHKYEQAIGVGECAGVIMDVVGGILQDAQEKLSLAQETVAEGMFADSIYHSYAALIIGAKGLLLSEDFKCNTHAGIIKDFQEHFVDSGKIKLEGTFSDLVLNLKTQEPSEELAKDYIVKSADFIKQVSVIREAQLSENGQDKSVVGSYYKA